MTSLLHKMKNRKHRTDQTKHDAAVSKVVQGIENPARCFSIDNASLPDEDLLYTMESLESMEPRSSRRFSVPALSRNPQQTQKQLIRQYFHEQVLDRKDFIRLKLIGSGSYGSVHLCVYKQKKTVELKNGTKVKLPPFAVKTIAKAPVLDNDKVRHMLAEKDVLVKCHHPNIVSLYATFQDKDYLCMVEEFIQAGELMTRVHASDQSGLPIDEARFYFAEAYAAINFFHSKHIVYRDIKPENIVLDHLGHLKFVDLGFAKSLAPSIRVAPSRIRSLLQGRDRENRPVFEKTSTLVGTPEYLAPEFLTKWESKDSAVSGLHGHEVDIWGLGILLYEMMTGSSPFCSSSSDISETYAKILGGRVNFTPSFDPTAKDLIKRLLVKKPDQRIGCGRKPAIHRHAFLKDHYKARDVLDGLLTPLWVPELPDGQLDCSYFDTNQRDLASKPARTLTDEEQKRFATFDTMISTFC